MVSLVHFFKDHKKEVNHLESQRSLAQPSPLAFRASGIPRSKVCIWILRAPVLRLLHSPTDSIKTIVGIESRGSQARTGSIPQMCS